MSLKRAKELVAFPTSGHEEECGCTLCQIRGELQKVDRHRPSEHAIVESERTLEEKVETHESFGMLRISRTQGGNFNLFGSDIQHHNTIELSVTRGERHRSLNRDWNTGHLLPLVTVRMSEVQFAQAITSLNMGSGVPCTVTDILGEVMERCPERTKMQEVHGEFRDSMKKIGAKITSLQDAVTEVLEAKGGLKAGEKKELAGKMASLLQDIESNVPFMAEQFTETVDRIMTEAKGEIEAHATGTVQRLGLKALAEKEGAAFDESIPIVALPSGSGNMEDE